MRDLLKSTVMLPITQRIAVKVILTLSQWIAAKTKNKLDDELVAAIKEVMGSK